MYIYLIYVDIDVTYGSLFIGMIVPKQVHDFGTRVVEWSVRDGFVQTPGEKKKRVLFCFFAISALLWWFKLWFSTKGLEPEVPEYTVDVRVLLCRPSSCGRL